MRLRWNPEGKGIRAIPPGLQDFARKKRMQFFTNMLASAAVGMVLTHAVDHLVRGNALAFSVTALVDSFVRMMGALVLTLGISAMA